MAGSHRKFRRDAGHPGRPRIFGEGTVVGPGQGAFRFSVGSPYRTWVGLTPIQRAWGGVITVGVGYGSYELGNGLGGAFFGDD